MGSKWNDMEASGRRKFKTNDDDEDDDDDDDDDDDIKCK